MGDVSRHEYLDSLLPYYINFCNRNDIAIEKLPSQF